MLNNSTQVLKTNGNQFIRTKSNIVFLEKCKGVLMLDINLVFSRDSGGAVQLVICFCDAISSTFRPKWNRGHVGKKGQKHQKSG